MLTYQIPLHLQIIRRYNKTAIAYKSETQWPTYKTIYLTLPQEKFTKEANLRKLHRSGKCDPRIRYGQTSGNIYMKITSRKTSTAAVKGDIDDVNRRRLSRLVAKLLFGCLSLLVQ